MELVLAGGLGFTLIDFIGCFLFGRSKYRQKYRLFFPIVSWKGREPRTLGSVLCGGIGERLQYLRDSGIDGWCLRFASDGDDLMTPVSPATASR
ncbi:MAG: hypothetical protein KGI68_10120 [Alphaproteobacteria bacterium]|nr:hypothetical protein [Alphaproteobacteria bacterium]MDE1985081.1 hypothetical protein [Alphaproteobacteria bacterium]MDE2161726.1 hypothetical protein [Alphaproteobacteria bacterium]MDE2267249.1 hypothetical protein [Alphaproteobacteria bacterium]MDE2499545.1 hypothetical protein [Alphaproteobacteria bacterium]